MKQNKPKHQTGPVIPEWTIDKQGHVIAVRDASFWKPLPGGAVECTLCYRNCVLKPGEDGWCQYRGNRGGKMVLHDHGVVASLVRQVRAFGPDPFLTFCPGALSLFVGLTHCTAGCVFCMSKEITWRPEAVPWAYGARTLARGVLYGKRAIVHPEGVVATAQQWQCRQILFGINEPLLSWEFTYDVCRLAKRAGLRTCIETNGFSTPAAVRKLAPYVDAIDLGTKGSCDPEFYRKWMRSPDAVPAVLASGKAWRDAGNVHVIVGDLIAPPHMQTDSAFEEHAKWMYDWIVAHLGEHTPVLITPIARPGPMAAGQSDLDWLLPRRAGDAAIIAYQLRQERAYDLAKAAGLHYAHHKRKRETFTCHQCGGRLLTIRSFCDDAWERHPTSAYEPCVNDADGPAFCPFWSHEQFVTDGRCDHCGAAVPIVTVSPAEIAAARVITTTEATARGLDCGIVQDAAGDTMPAV
jgi:pyruvate formate lyase activating enzyme